MEATMLSADAEPQGAARDAHAQSLVHFLTFSSFWSMASDAEASTRRAHDQLMDAEPQECTKWLQSAPLRETKQILMEKTHQLQTDVTRPEITFRGRNWAHLKALNQLRSVGASDRGEIQNGDRRIKLKFANFAV